MPGCPVNTRNGSGHEKSELNEVAKAFPNEKAAKDAPRGLLDIAETTARLTRRSIGRASKATRRLAWALASRNYRTRIHWINTSTGSQKT